MTVPSHCYKLDSGLVVFNSRYSCVFLCGFSICFTGGHYNFYLYEEKKTVFLLHILCVLFCYQLVYCMPFQSASLNIRKACYFSHLLCTEVFGDFSGVFYVIWDSDRRQFFIQLFLYFCPVLCCHCVFVCFFTVIL